MIEDKFPRLTESLDVWAEFVTDSPVASFLRKRIEEDLLKGHYPQAHSAFRADLACFLSAVYAGGLAEGRASVDKGGTYTTLYIASSGGDDMGRNDELIGIFSTFAEAEETVKGRGWYGGDGSIKKDEGYFAGDYIIFPRIMIEKNDLNVDLPKKRNNMREAALAKLTDEDKVLLGLVD